MKLPQAFVKVTHLMMTKLIKGYMSGNVMVIKLAVSLCSSSLLVRWFQGFFCFFVVVVVVVVVVFVFY